MIEFLYGLIEEHAFSGLFVASFLASTILPLGSEAFVVLLLSQGRDPFTVIIVASAGNYMGSCTTYYLGLWGRTDIIEKYFSISPRQMEKTDHLFSRYGTILLLFTWLPVIGDAIAAAAGLLKVDFKVFSLYVFTGKIVRYILLAYITLNALSLIYY